MFGLSRRGVAPFGRLWPALGGTGLGLGAGFALEYAGTPLPWMIGPLLAIAAARVAGVPLSAISGGRQAGQWMVGTALGLYFTPVVAARVSGIARSRRATRRPSGLTATDATSGLTPAQPRMLELLPFAGEVANATSLRLRAPRHCL